MSDSSMLYRGGPVAASFTCILLLLMASPYLHAKPYIDFSSDSYSQAFSIQALIDDKPSTPKSGDSIYSFNRFSTGWKSKNWSVGIISRYDGIIRHSEDAALLYYQDKAKKPASKNQQYNYHLRADVLQSTGLSLSVPYQISPDIKLSTRGHIYKTSHLTNGNISGNIGLNGTQLSGNLDVEYRYEEDKLFDRPIDVQPTGTAYSFDIDLTANIQLWMLRLKIEDLIHRVYWEDVPTTVAQAAPNNQSIDSNGLLQVSPVISGREFNKGFVQSLPMRSQLSVSREVQQGHRLTAQIKGIDNRYYPMLSYALNISDKQTVSAGYELETQAIYTSWQYQSFKLSLALDRSFSSAHRAFLNISYNVN